MDGGTASANNSPPTLPFQDMQRLQLHLYRFDRAARAQSLWAGSYGDRKGARDCVNFYEGEQWTEEEIKVFKEDDRPYLTINKIGRLIRLVLGYQRQNRHEPIATPDNDLQASQDVADMLTHMMKNTLDDNKYKWIESRVFEDGITTGRGYFDVRLDFTNNLLGDAVVTDLDPFSVYPDPDGQKYDGSDWSYYFHTSWMSLDQIVALFGLEAYNAARSQALGTSQAMLLSEEASMDDMGPRRYFGLFSWFDDKAREAKTFDSLAYPFTMTDHFDKAQKTIRIVDGQHRMYKRCAYLVDVETMGMREIPDHWDKDRVQRCIDWAAMQGRTIQVLRRSERRVRWIITAGDIILFDEWSPYKDFTLVPYFPYFRRGMTRGMIHDLIDPQREINKRRSAQIHIVGTQANSGWIFEEGSLDDDEEDNLKESGARPGVIIKYRMGTTKPERIQPAAAPTAMERLEKMSSDDLTEVSGVNESSLGELDVVQSGVAIKNRQQQTVVGLEPVLDNLDLSRVLVGERIVYLFQNFYLEPRFYRATGMDGKPIEFTINQLGAVDAILNDISVGKYRVTVNSVPATDTFNERQFNQLKDMVAIGVLPPIVAAPKMIDVSNIPDKENMKAQTMAIFSMMPPAPPAPTGTPAAQPGAA